MAMSFGTAASPSSQRADTGAVPRSWAPVSVKRPPRSAPALPNRPMVPAAASAAVVPSGIPAATLPTDVSSRFGRRLREVRLSRSLTQTDMARKFGIDRGFISEIECGHKAISLPMLEVLALGLQLTLSELFQDL